MTLFFDIAWSIVCGLFMSLVAIFRPPRSSAWGRCRAIAIGSGVLCLVLLTAAILYATFFPGSQVDSLLFLLAVACFFIYWALGVAYYVFHTKAPSSGTH